MMTPEEIQRTIEGMLQVQRELQESRIRLQQELQSLAELSRSGERKLERLTGYSITQESDILDVREEIASLKARVSALEGEGPPSR